MIAHLFQQFGGHSRRYVLVCSFWRLFTIKIFPFSCWKLIMIFFYFKKIKLPARCCKMAPKWFNLLKTFHCKIFPFSCWKLIMIFIYFKKTKLPARCCKMAPEFSTSWTIKVSQWNFIITRLHIYNPSLDSITRLHH